MCLSLQVFVKHLPNLLCFGKNSNSVLPIIAKSSFHGPYHFIYEIYLYLFCRWMFHMFGWPQIIFILMIFPAYENKDKWIPY